MKKFFALLFCVALVSSSAMVTGCSSDDKGKDKDKDKTEKNDDGGKGSDDKDDKGSDKK